MRNVAVIGAGSWGTAVASILGAKGVRTALWARSSQVADGVNTDHRNPRYLAGLDLDPQVWATTDIEEALREAEVIVMATPSQAIRDAARSIDGLWDGRAPIVSLAKGLERGTLFRMTEVLEDVLGHRQMLATLSGPNHAEEVSALIPSATVVAAYDPAIGVALRDLFSTSTFRAYTNPDVIGVELAGASKNVIAVAAGMSDGLGFGDNTKATLMTRGLAEMSRLARAAGANPLTSMGLAGMGDLIATCTSLHSRNRGLGERIARGGTVADFERETHMVAEGAVSCVTVDELGARHGIEMPITHQVRAIVHGGLPVSSAAEALMGRNATDELHGMDLIDT